MNIRRPLRSRLGLAYNLGVLDTVGLPTTVLMRIPQLGEHDLCFDKTCQETASRYVWSWLKKNGLNITEPWHDVMLPKHVSRLRFVEILFSLRWYVEFILQGRILSFI